MEESKAELEVEDSEKEEVESTNLVSTRTFRSKTKSELEPESPIPTWMQIEVTT